MPLRGSPLMTVSNSTTGLAALVRVIAAGANAPGFAFLRRLTWVEAPRTRRCIGLSRALKGESIVTTTPLWKLVNPYRGLEAMTEANTD
jgi:hypothetical protein